MTARQSAGVRQNIPTIRRNTLNVNWKANEMKTLNWVGWSAAIISVTSCLAMFYTFEHGMYSLGFVTIYGFISFFTISAVSFRIHARMKIAEGI